MTHGGELNSQADIVDEAGRLFRRLPPRRLSTHHFFELRPVSPKRRRVDFTRRFLFADDEVDAVLAADFLLQALQFSRQLDFFQRMLDAQTQLVQAELSLVQAQLGYQRAVAAVQTATGELLEKNRVQITAD